jgi:hypothetical protein
MCRGDIEHTVFKFSIAAFEGCFMMNANIWLAIFGFSFTVLEILLRQEFCQ